MLHRHRILRTLSSRCIHCNLHMLSTLRMRLPPKHPHRQYTTKHTKGAKHSDQVVEVLLSVVGGWV